jgi:NAD(P)-dependent dehydrogenase (short-subunit alcohol dehydrogenase family)
MSLAHAGASQHALAEDTTAEVAQKLFQLNTLGPINLTQALLPLLLAPNNAYPDSSRNASQHRHATGSHGESQAVSASADGQSTQSGHAKGANGQASDAAAGSGPPNSGRQAAASSGRQEAAQGNSDGQAAANSGRQGAASSGRQEMSKAQRPCHITVVGSMAGKVPSPGQSVYSGCKTALMGYFASLQTELSARSDPQASIYLLTHCRHEQWMQNSPHHVLCICAD